MGLLYMVFLKCQAFFHKKPTFFSLFFFNGINDLQKSKKIVKNRKNRLTDLPSPVIMGT